MRWLLRKLDSLFGMILAVAGGIGASQYLAFMQQYRQRLGGHLDEARRHLAEMAGGETTRALDARARGQLVDLAQARVAELREATLGLDAAGPLAKPFVFLAHLDGGIAAATLNTFEPQLPLDLASLVYAGIGVLLVFVLYEAAKSPVRRHAERRRRAPRP